MSCVDNGHIIMCDYNDRRLMGEFWNYRQMHCWFWCFMGFVDKKKLYQQFVVFQMTCLSISLHLSPPLSDVEVIYQLGTAIFKGCLLQCVNVKNSGSCWGSLLNPIIFQKAKTTWMLLTDTCIYRHKYSCL